MVKIAPSILAADFARMGEEVARMEANGADMIHCDIMDGSFVPNLSFGPTMVAALRKHVKIPLDVHIMAEHPEWMIAPLRDAGADYVTLHVEAVTHLQRALSQIRAAGMGPGVTLNPATPVETLEWVLPDVDLVLMMTVNPGFGGQKLIPQTIQKVQRVRGMLDAISSDAMLLVDGGVDLTTARPLREAGADVFIAGNMLFSAADAGKAIRELREACGD